MTVVVAVSDGTRVCVASDSQITDNGHVIIGDSKIIRHGEALFACDGAQRLGDLIRYNPPPMENLPQMGLARWACTDFVRWLKAEVEADKITMGDADGRFRIPGSTLIAYKNECAVIGKDGAYVARDWVAIGSGRTEASGAVWAELQHEHWQADEVAMMGVRAAIEMDDGCSEPIHHKWTKP